MPTNLDVLQSILRTINSPEEIDKIIKDLGIFTITNQDGSRTCISLGQANEQGCFDEKGMLRDQSGKKDQERIAVSGVDIDFAQTARVMGAIFPADQLKELADDEKDAVKSLTDCDKVFMQALSFHTINKCIMAEKQERKEMGWSASGELSPEEEEAIRKQVNQIIWPVALDTTCKFVSRQQSKEIKERREKRRAEKLGPARPSEVNGPAKLVCLDDPKSLRPAEGLRKRIMDHMIFELHKEGSLSVPHQPDNCLALPGRLAEDITVSSKPTGSVVGRVETYELMVHHRDSSYTYDVITIPSRLETLTTEETNELRRYAENQVLIHNKPVLVRHEPARTLTGDKPDHQKEFLDFTVLIADSLSDTGKMFRKMDKRLGCVGKWALGGATPLNRFSNGCVWPDYFRGTHPGCKEVTYAEGGATLYDYGSWRSFIHFHKSIATRLFIGSGRQQVRECLADHPSLDGAGILIELVANDFVTVGYCDKPGADRALWAMENQLVMPLAARGAAHFVLFCAANHTVAPRCRNEPEAKKEAEREVIQYYNKENLEKLKDGYDLHKDANFRMSTAHIVLQCHAPAECHLPKGKNFIVTGHGTRRVIYFSENEQFLRDRAGQPLATEIELSNKEWKLAENYLEDANRRKRPLHAWPFSLHIVRDTKAPDGKVVKKKRFLDLNEAKALTGHSMIIQGEGETRRVHFVHRDLKDGGRPKYEHMPDGAGFLTLSQKEWKRLEKNMTHAKVDPSAIDEELQKKVTTQLAPYLEQTPTLHELCEGFSVLDKMTKQAAAQAKLNIDVRIFDINEPFMDVNRRPEHFGGTIGISLITTHAADEALYQSVVEPIMRQGKSAVILQELDIPKPECSAAEGAAAQPDDSAKKRYRVHIIKDGQYNPGQKAGKKTVIGLREDSRLAIQEVVSKIKDSAAQPYLTIVGCTQLRPPALSSVISHAVGQYNKDHGTEELSLADTSITLIEARKINHLPKEKEGQPSPAGGTIYHDPLHPVTEVQSVIGSKAVTFFDGNFVLKKVEKGEANRPVDDLSSPYVRGIDLEAKEKRLKELLNEPNKTNGTGKTNDSAALKKKSVVMDDPSLRDIDQAGCRARFEKELENMGVYRAASTAPAAVCYKQLEMRLVHATRAIMLRSIDNEIARLTRELHASRNAAERNILLHKIDAFKKFEVCVFIFNPDESADPVDGLEKLNSISQTWRADKQCAAAVNQHRGFWSNFFSMETASERAAREIASQARRAILIHRAACRAEATDDMARYTTMSTRLGMTC